MFNRSTLRNQIKTDGTCVDFLISRAEEKSSDVLLPNLNIENYEEWELNHVVRMWGVDPGDTDVFMAADSTNDMSNQETSTNEIRFFSKAENYVKAEFKKNAFKLIKLKAERDITPTETTVPTYKTSRLSRYNEHLIYLFANFGTLMNALITRSLSCVSQIIEGNRECVRKW